MKKMKMVLLSLIVVLSSGFAFQLPNVQAAESTETKVEIASDRIWVSKTLPYTRETAIWVTEARNGKIYSGYLYNRGFADGTGHYSFFSGYLLTGGPYAPI